MNRGKFKNHSDFLAGLLLFGIFAFGLVAALLAGAGAYRRITERDSSDYDRRISSQYIVTKVRSAAGPENVGLAELEGIDGQALAIRETASGREYISYIYCYDGWIRELLVPAAASPSCAAGEKLLEADGLDFRLENGLLTAVIDTKDGSTRTVYVSAGTAERESA